MASRISEVIGATKRMQINALPRLSRTCPNVLGPGTLAQQLQTIRANMDGVATDLETEATDAEGTAALRPARPGVGVRRQELVPETLRLYAADWARFADFCADSDARALPAAAGTVIAFLQRPVRDAAPWRAASPPSTIGTSSFLFAAPATIRRCAPP